MSLANSVFTSLKRKISILQIHVTKKNKVCFYKELKKQLIFQGLSQKARLPYQVRLRSLFVKNTVVSQCLLFLQTSSAKRKNPVMGFFLLSNDIMNVCLTLHAFCGFPHPFDVLFFPLCVSVRSQPRSFYVSRLPFHQVPRW